MKELIDSVTAKRYHLDSFLFSFAAVESLIEYLFALNDRCYVRL